MTILYMDSRNTKRIEKPDLREQIQAILAGIFAHADQVDCVWIDLRGDIEACYCFDIAHQRQIGSMGGAIAWQTYQRIAELAPEINFHFRKPTVLLPGQ